MVIGGGGGDQQAAAMQPPMPAPLAQPASIDNIMSGISNTGSVRMNNHRKKLRQRFDIIKKLGQGTYGKVQLGINKETGQEVAIKTIKKCKITTDADLVRIRREVQIMSSVQHPNIIHIYEVFENREKMVLVMEFAAGGELYDYLSERKVLAEEEARRVFRQIATAVYYCHKHKICHRDLKLENILLDEHGSAKIADFGLSNVFDNRRMLATFCGSPLYASPEIVKGTPYEGPEVDCWSLGVLLYTLVYGAMPFDGSNFKRLVKQISAGDYYEPKKSSPASPLIREMLTVCPLTRATIEQICNHWWVNEGYGESCLDLAEELANQTPVRLDVLLSLTPQAVTSDQLVVPNVGEHEHGSGGAAGGGGGKVPERVARSLSVGSVRDIASTEAERRILDMVAAGGEAALAPSPTRTITPSESPAQPKRKLEMGVSTESVLGIAMKKDKLATVEALAIAEAMDEDGGASAGAMRQSAGNVSVQLPESPTNSDEMEQQQQQMQNLNAIEEMCNELLQDAGPARSATMTMNANDDEFNVPKQSMMDVAEPMAVSSVAQPQQPTSPEKKKVLVKKKIVKPAGGSEAGDETKTGTAAKKSPIKVVKKIFGKTKTTDLGEHISNVTPEAHTSSVATAPTVERKFSLPEEATAKSAAGAASASASAAVADRRRSRIFEAAEKFQVMNSPTQTMEKPAKKIVIPGVSVGNFKKEFERKASLTSSVVAAAASLTDRRNSATAMAADDVGGSRRCSTSSSTGSATMDVQQQQQQQSSGAAHPHASSEPTTPTYVATVHAQQTPPASPLQTPSTVGVGGDKDLTAFSSFSLREARRSMENSIALLQQAKTESSKEVDQLCAQTEGVRVSDPSADPASERLKKIRNAREIIGNAIPVGRSAGMGVRKPPVPFGMNGRSVSGSVVPSPSTPMNSDRKTLRVQMGADRSDMRTATLSVSTPEQKTFDRGEPLASRPLAVGTLIEQPETGTTKTSRAEITLKSATLPRRKPAKTEIKLDIQSKVEPSMRFQTEMQHHMPDLRSAPIHEHAFSPPIGGHHNRAASLEPQANRDHFMHRPAAGSAFARQSVRPGSLSKQHESDTESTVSRASQSSSTATNTTTNNNNNINNSSTAQPIKKSPREFIIPIAVEGGGFVTPRAGSLEPSESGHHAASGSASSFGRLGGRPRRIGSLLSDGRADSEEDSVGTPPPSQAGSSGGPFHQRLHRHTSLGRGDSDADDVGVASPAVRHFPMHRLRTARPSRTKLTAAQEPSNDSGSSGEDDDEDGFELLTAENLFSTLLSRVRALTNKLNVNDHPTTAAGFPATRFMSNLRQTHSPFWNHDPFGSRLNNGSGPWRHSLSRDLSSDIDSMFSRTGATLPRGEYRKK